MYLPFHRLEGDRRRFTSSHEAYAEASRPVCSKAVGPSVCTSVCVSVMDDKLPIWRIVLPFHAYFMQRNIK